MESECRRARRRLKSETPKNFYRKFRLQKLHDAKYMREVELRERSIDPDQIKVCEHSTESCDC
jgi:hypothetical protein